MSSGGSGGGAGKWISAIVGATIAVGAVAITVLTAGTGGQTAQTAAAPASTDADTTKKKSATVKAAAADAAGKKPLAVAQPVKKTGAPSHAPRPSLGGIRVTDPLFGVLDRLHQSVADQKRDRSDQKTVIHSSAHGLGSRLPNDKGRWIAKGFFTADYQAVKLTSKSFNVSTPVFYTICYRYLRIPDACTLRSVNRTFHAFASTLLANRSYLHHHATIGFEDGVNGRRRGQVWKIVTGADETIRNVRVSERTDPSLKGSGRTLYIELLSRRGKSYGDVEKDCNRTLTHHTSFVDEKSAEKALQNVLNAYSIHDVAVGYCQGMNFLAAFVLTKLKEEEAYWTWYTAMNNPRYNFREYFFPDLQGVLIAKYQFRYLFEAFLPALNEHFIANDVPGDCFTEWFMTLFTFRRFPRDTAARVWDLLLVDGPKTLFRVALAILYLGQDTLLAGDFETIFNWTKQLPDQKLLNEHAVIKTALTFQVTNSLLDRLTAQYWRQFEE